MKRYIHGSEDSLDVDVLYVFEEMPSFLECQKFCSNKDENRNIIVINNGFVTDCFKGTIDELNNGLYVTYKLHEQKYENPIKTTMERDVLIKIVRVVRCLLSHCSRTQYRNEVKAALKSSNWKDKLKTLENIDFSSIESYGKNGSKEDILKIFAFQIGQVLGLIYDIELYSKSSIAKTYPKLEKYLYRQKDADVNDLYIEIKSLLYALSALETTEQDGITHFIDFDKKIDLVKEKYV